MINLCFFYPSKNIGGAQLLFCRMGYEIKLKYPEYNISYIDFSDGFYSKFFEDKNIDITFIDYEKLNHNLLSEITDVVCPLSYIYIINNLKFNNLNFKLFFWDLHPHNLIATSHFYTPIYRFLNTTSVIKIYPILECFRRKKIKNFLDNAITKGGVRFMCESNMTFNRKIFSFDKKNNFLPIFLPNYSNELELSSPDDKSVINFCWLGRIDEDKYRILLGLINDIINSRCKAVIHVIGNGNKVDELYKTFKGVNFKMLGVLQGDELNSYLISNVNVLFGVGTSVLEGGKLGIPSVFCSLFAKINDTHYNWMFDVNGKNVTVPFFDNSRCVNLNTILSELSTNKDLGVQCKSYYENNHSVDSVLNIFNRSLLENKLTFQEYVKLEINDLSFLESIIIIVKRVIKKIRKKK